MLTVVALLASGVPRIIFAQEELAITARITVEDVKRVADRDNARWRNHIFFRLTNADDEAIQLVQVFGGPPRSWVRFTRDGRTGTRTHYTCLNGMGYRVLKPGDSIGWHLDLDEYTRYGEEVQFGVLVVRVKDAEDKRYQMILSDPVDTNPATENQR